MIRNLLATTALATLVSMGAYAQEATTPAPADPAPVVDPAAPAAPVAKADGHLATSIIGETVYNGTGEDAQNIGEVNDIVIGKDANIEAIVVGVGGFLGIGEKDVAIEYAALDWAEKDGDSWLVTPMTKEQLETSRPSTAPLMIRHRPRPQRPIRQRLQPIRQWPPPIRPFRLRAMKRRRLRSTSRH